MNRRRAFPAPGFMCLPVAASTVSSWVHLLEAEPHSELDLSWIVDLAEADLAEITGSDCGDRSAEDHLVDRVVELGAEVERDALGDRETLFNQRIPVHITGVADVG